MLTQVVSVACKRYSHRRLTEESFSTVGVERKGKAEAYYFLTQHNTSAQHRRQCVRYMPFMRLGPVDCIRRFWNGFRTDSPLIGLVSHEA